MILLVDHYDSFVHNLARHVRLLGHATEVVRHDSIDPEQVRRLRPEAVILSPGPGSPQQVAASIDLVREVAQEIPILGVCLGHQIVAEAFGVPVVAAPSIYHGRVSAIEHQGNGLFANLPQPLVVCRYHSLVVDQQSLADSDELVPTAWTPEGRVMAMRHTTLPIAGVQFHPEAILTEHGLDLLANFFRWAEAR